MLSTSDLIVLDRGGIRFGLAQGDCQGSACQGLEKYGKGLREVVGEVVSRHAMVTVRGVEGGLPRGGRGGGFTVRSC